MLAKLQHEIDEVMPDSRVIPDLSLLQELPYLNAFLKEGLILECILFINWLTKGIKLRFSSLHRCS